MATANDAGSDMERVLDKLDEIGKQITDLSVRLAKVEQMTPACDARVAALELRVATLESRLVAAETRIAIYASLAAGAGGGIGLIVQKLLGH